jgi:hypothetical protein
MRKAEKAENVSAIGILYFHTFVLIIFGFGCLDLFRMSVVGLNV